MYGVNVYNEESQNDLTATQVFLTWYNKRENYDYLIEPEVGAKSGKFIVQHIMFI